MDEKLVSLIEYLNARTAEYDEGHPTISDEEWDNKYFELIELEHELGFTYQNSPTQRVIYETVNALKKVQHNHKMLSLDKTKDISEVSSFIGDKPFLAMCKMDGLTCSLRYINGVLVGAETRGNGTVGENIIHNAKVIKSIPNTIPVKEEVVIDGEIICSYKDFEAFSSDYKNPRNFAAGSIRLLDARECAARNLTFVAWEVIEGFSDLTLLSEKLSKLSSIGFTIVPFMKVSSNVSLDEIPGAISSIAQFKSFPIDGVVFKFDDIDYGKTLGETSHHFKNAIAFKFYDEVYETSLKNIEWTMGRTGILTPIAVFNPVEIEGSIVERASLHNISVMTETLGDIPYEGQIVYVYKANMIIPQIYSAVKLGENETATNLFAIPTVCPVCGNEAKIVESDSGVLNLVCVNSSCDGKLINKLDHYCGKKGLDIKGLSKATLEKLIDWGWVSSICDLYELENHKAEWVQKSGFGEKSVSNILNAINSSGKNCELWQFISALGIPLIGSTYAKQIAKMVSTWDELKEAIANKYDFCEWEGFGIEMTTSLWNFMYGEADYLCTNVLTITNSLQGNSMNSEPQPLTGINVVITGKLNTYKNRNLFKDDIEKLGGKVVDSITKKTDYLVNNDVNSTSAKNQAAKKLGIPILSEQDFIEKFFQ